MTGKAVDDRSGVRRALAGDPSAFRSLVDRYAPGLMHYCRGMGQSESDAEDLVQDAFVRAWQARDRYDERWAVSTWLYTIIRRLSINHTRKAKRMTTELQEHHAIDEAELDAERPGDGLWQLARTHLKERQFELLWLFYGEDLSLEAIARVLEITPVNARVSLHRARERLKTILERERPELAQALKTESAA